MNPRSHFVLLTGILILAGAAGFVLLHEAGLAASQHRHAEQFQRLFGGIGLGPALDLSACPMCFDPRVSPFCQEDYGPIPGGQVFCPHHSCSVFYYPSLIREEPE